jgi:hypothetical protein
MKPKLIETEAEYIAMNRANPRKYWRGPSWWLESMARGEQDHRIKASYLKKIKKLVKMGIPVPDSILDQAPEYRKAQTDYERYLKGRHTSHANVSIAVEDLRESVGYKLKRQDGKVLTDEHKQDVEQGVVEMETVLPGIRKAMRRGDITIAHTSGKHPFLSQAGGTYTPSERSISVGIKVEGTPVRALAHELAHWLDYEGHGGKEGRIAVYGLGWAGKYVQTRCFSELDKEGGKLVSAALDAMNADRESYFNSPSATMRKLFPVAGEEAPELSKDEKITRVRVGRYWRRPTEVFARLAEQYVATVLGEGSNAAAGPSYYEKHDFYWSKKQFAKLMPMIKKQLAKRVAHLSRAASRAAKVAA